MKAELLQRVFEKTPTQAKKIKLFFERTPEAERGLEQFLELYRPYLQSRGLGPVELADAYLEMVDQMMHSRLAFLREGRYPASDQAQAFTDVYSQPERMVQYMFGAAISLFLWKNHWQMFQFYRRCLPQAAQGSAFLEVGCGHGYHLTELYSHLKKGQGIDVVDISPTSLELAAGLLKAIDPALFARTRFTQADLAVYEGRPGGYDFITMGEVLEHLDDAPGMLRRLHQLLAKDGRLFITTCANCPAIDHVYHFTSVQHIRDTLTQAGLAIVEEVVAPSEDRSEADLERMKIDIAYAALLKRA
jgi:2-polyprenyl-3-methyl-5-hydroxy-6-metoxy-1,4-benzoquinol methylase